MLVRRATIFTCSFIFLLIISTSLTHPDPIRHKRSQPIDENNSDSSSPLDSQNCKVQCLGQWDADFKQQFLISPKKLYEFPLHPFLAHSKERLQDYCCLAEEKFNCLRNKCDINEFSWSMEKHICLDHRQEFDNNFDCIQKSQMNHRCTKKCEDEAKNLVDLTAEATEELHFNEANIWEFRYKNRMCHLQTCYYECRMHLIDNKCHENEKVETKKVIRSYYSAQNLDEWEEYRKANMTTLFPRLCRRFLPTEYQVHSEPENCQRSMIPDADFLDCSEVGVISKIREIVESTIYRSSG